MHHNINDITEKAHLSLYVHFYHIPIIPRRIKKIQFTKVSLK